MGCAIGVADASFTVMKCFVNVIFLSGKAELNFHVDSRYTVQRNCNNLKSLFNWHSSTIIVFFLSFAYSCYNPADSHIQYFTEHL